MSYSSIRVNKAASELAILALCSYSRANSETVAADLRAAGASAVSVGDAAASGELLALAVTDVLSTGSVGGKSHDGDGD
jgi:hypothetical protein